MPIATRPARCTLANVATGETMACLFNPTQLTEKLQINWNRLTVPGLSHQVLQYQSTGNTRLEGVEFYQDALAATWAAPAVGIDEFRNFLLALTVPPMGTEGVLDTAPARVLVVWPKLLVMEAVLTEVEFQYRQFGADGSALIYTAVCSFEEVRDVRMFAELLRYPVRWLT